MKNLLLYSTIFLTGVSALAQLTVKPNGTRDSYVYVKNQILYVDKEIHLEKNSSSNDVEASIYLRDNGQLIQGGDTSINTGDGFLSVQQNTKPTNAYAYYYWASPVGNPLAETTVGNNTKFGLGSIYEALDGELGTKAQLSDNVSTKEGFTLPKLTISKRWMYIHPNPGTEKEGNYIRINASNAVPAGYGFTMKGVHQGTIPDPNNPPQSSHDQIYEFRGRPNNGDFTINVAGPQDPPTQADAVMTLSGNPYPSALDLNRVYHDTDNDQLAAFFFYDEDRSKMTHLYSQKPFGYGVYVPGPPDPDGYPGSPNFAAGNYVNATFYIWNSGGQQTGGGTYTSTYPTAHRFAPIGQGIMFVGRDPIDATHPDGYPIKIKNTHRRFIREDLANHSVFHRPTGDDETAEQDNGENNPMRLTAEYAANVDNRTPQLRLYTIFDDALTRDMLLLFSPQATDGYDRGWDGLSPGGMKSDVFFPISDDTGTLPYVIQGTNYDVGKEIPITFKLHKSSKIEMRAVEEVKKPYEIAYLFDRVENTYRPLVKAATATASFTLPAGTYENRFYIVFSKPGGKELPHQAQKKEEVLANVNFFQNNPAQRLEVRNPQGYTLKSASMYDMNGKLVIHEKNLGDNSSYSFYTGHLSDGVYVVKLLTDDDVAIDYKAIVMNK